MAERAPSPLREAWARHRGVALAALLFAGIFGIAALLGFAAYRAEVGSDRAELQRQMQAVARLKAEAVATWLEERRNEIAMAATGPRIALDFERWQETGAVSPVLKGRLTKRLGRLREFGDCTEVVVLGRDGVPILSSEGYPVGGDSPGLELARAAMQQQGVLFSPLIRPGTAEGPPPLLDAIAPLTAEDERGVRTVGALVYRIDPAKRLYPLIQYWPTDSPSAESLLVVRDGEEVLYLNELRHRPGIATQLRMSASDAELVAAKAVRGARGISEGKSYRRVPVLASIEQVRGAEWILVSEVAQSEAYGSLRDYLWIYLAFLACAAILAGVVARAWLRGVREAVLRREHERTKQYVSALKMAEAEREKLIESLTRALDDVKTLRGIVPICASCKRIRDDAGYWNQVELYVTAHTQAQFSHGICPECLKRLYPDYSD